MSQASALSPGGYVRQGQRGASPPRSVNVQVAVRCRPINERERTHSERTILSCDENRGEVVFSGTQITRKATTTTSAATSTNVNGKRTFTYDHVFDHHASQADVYQRLVQPIVDEVLEGYNCTVFAYGQTGTGKTHTMEGRRHDDVLTGEDRRLPLNAGIIPRAINQIFNHLRCLTDEHSVRVSHLELYNEQLTDLLSPEDAELRVYEDSSKGTFVQGLEDTVVSSEQEIFAVLDKSAMKRKTAETNMNKFSSRSHSIFSITIHIKESTPEGADLLKVGKLNLVDLAGSENVGRSGAVKGRAREAGNINQSLLTLGRVITALVDRHPHVPYRDSKLTRLLQESLGGRNKTCIIATVTPASGSIEETLSTLDYAYRAKSIKNRPTVNQMIAKHVLLKEYTHEIAKLKRELDATREKNGVYLSPEEYDRLLKQQTQIDSLETQSEDFEKKIQALQQSLDRTQQNLQREQRELSETRVRLEHTSNELTSTKKELRVRTQQRDENGVLVKQHVNTEKVLTAKGSNLQSTLSESLRHIDALHTRMEVKEAHERDNVRMFSELKQDIGSYLSKCRAAVDKQKECYEEMSADTLGMFENLRGNLEKSYSEVMERCGTLQTSLKDHETNGFEKTSDQYGEFEKKLHTCTADAEATLSGYTTLNKEGHESISSFCNEVNQLLARGLETMNTTLRAVREHTENLNHTLSEHSTEQKSSFSQIEQAIAVMTTEQSKLVVKLQSISDSDAEQQKEALDMTQARVLEQVSTIFSELKASTTTRLASKSESERDVYSALESVGEATQQAVKDQCGKLCKGIDTSMRVCESRGAEVCEIVAAHETGMRTAVVNDGAKKILAIEACSLKSVNGWSRAHGSCTDAISGVRLLVEEHGSAVRAGMECERRGREGLVNEMVEQLSQNCHSSNEKISDTHSSMQNRISHATSQISDGVLKFASDIVDPLQRRVDHARLEADDQANTAPARREWPTSLTAPLPRTRNHESLICEDRAKREAVDTENVNDVNVEIADFGHDVDRTPVHQKGSAELAEVDISPNRRKRDNTTSSYTPTESSAGGHVASNGTGMMTEDSGESAGKKRKNVDSDGIQETPHPHHPSSGEERLGSSSIQPGEKEESGAHPHHIVSDDAAEASSGAEENHGDDDGLSHNNSNSSSGSKSKEVLGDVSNRKTVPRRSARGIKPVIKKASGIPAPRRGRRLQPSHQ